MAGEAQREALDGARPDVLRRVRSSGVTVAALHDINLPAFWYDTVHVLAGGRVVASGPPEEALTAERVSEVFGVAATSFVHPVSGKRQLLFDRAKESS
jgi:iron complex transport system ATP-binding protein